MLFPLAVYKQPLVKNADFYWPLALAALKNASANSSRTAAIELLCTSGFSAKWWLLSSCFAGSGKWKAFEHGML
jgi:hypothetical protein